MPVNGNHRDSLSNSRTRRRFLQTVGGVGAAGIAGCSGGDTGGAPTGTSQKTGISGGDGTPGANEDTPSPTEAKGEILKSTIDITGQVPGPPDTLQYNPFGQNFDSTSNLTAYEQVGHFDLKEFFETGDIKFIPRGAGSWEIPEGPREGDTIRITANDDRTWHDGDPITSDDLYASYRLHGFFGAPYTNMVDFDSIRRVDGKTIEMTVVKKTNTNLLKQRILGQAYGWRFNAKFSIYEDFLDNIETAAENEDDEALQQAKQELSEFELDEPVGTGWAKYVRRTPEKVVYEPHENHPIGSQMEFEEWTNAFADNQQGWQLALGQHVDSADGGPKNILEKLMDNGYSAFRHHFLSAQALQFNQAEKPYDDPRIRKAFAYAINMDKAINPIKVKGPWGQQRWLVEKPSGTMVNRDAWLGDLQDSLVSYSPKSQNMDKVVELMQDAGYERSVNGKWAKDGQLFTVELKHYDWSYIVTYVQSVKEDLEAADFAVETAAPSTMTGDIFNGDYAFATGFWGQSWHPATSYDVMTPNAGWMATNPPEVLEVPPVGEPDSSDTIEINAWETYEEMETASDFAEAQAAVQKLAWAWNQTLPQIEVFNGTAMLVFNTTDFRFKGGIDNWDAKLLDGQFEVFNRGAYQVRRGER